MNVLRPELQELLVEQATAEAVQRDGRVARRRGRLAAWFASHSLLALLGGALVVGGAGATTAAVVSTIHGTPSAPTHGTIPAIAPRYGHRTLPPVARESYRIVTVPSLQVGQPGWCDAFGVSSKARPSFGSYGCGGAPTAQSHVFSGSAGGSGRSFEWRLVDQTVAYAETPDGKHFLPRSDPGLPNGWQMIVLLPGQTHNDHLRFRDAAGRPVSPRMKTVGESPIADSTGSTPGGSVCGIVAPRGFDARGSHWVTALRPTTNLNGAAFMPCAQTAYRIDDAWAEVTVLVDAASAGTAEPAALPGTQPVPNTPGLFDLAAIGALYFPKPPFTPKNVVHGPVDAGWEGSAHRVGRAWVVVRAKSPALRERVLRAVTIRSPGSPS